MGSVVPVNAVLGQRKSALVDKVRLVREEAHVPRRVDDTSEGDPSIEDAFDECFLKLCR